MQELVAARGSLLQETQQLLATQPAIKLLGLGICGTYSALHTQINRYVVFWYLHSSTRFYFPIWQVHAARKLNTIAHYDALQFYWRLWKKQFLTEPKKGKKFIAPNSVPNPEVGDKYIAFGNICPIVYQQKQGLQNVCILFWFSMIF